tara:strand:- start:3149 stop:3667 length:519 start_codon:yes stop_codon:yes gene_type:complete
MNKTLISFLIFILVSAPAYSKEKIVYLDVEKIMQESTAGKSIIAQLKKKRETSISKFQKKEKNIIDKEKKLISQKNVLSKEEFENKIIELRKDISNYQKERNQASNKITKSRLNASKKLISKLTPILEDYSKKNSIRIIVQKKHIVMGKKEDDITKDILELVNQNVKSIKLD